MNARKKAALTRLLNVDLGDAKLGTYELARLLDIFRERLDARRGDIQCDLTNYSTWLKERTEELGKVEDQVRQEVARMAEVMVKLRAAGVKFTRPWGTRIQ